MQGEPGILQQEDIMSILVAVSLLACDKREGSKVTALTKRGVIMSHT